MANNVTKEYIRLTCVNNLIALASASVDAQLGSPDVAGTPASIGLAQAGGLGFAQLAVTGAGSYWNVQAGITNSTLTLYNTVVAGPEIQAAVKELMTICNRIRRLRFVKTVTYAKSGNAGDAWSGFPVPTYTRVAFLNTSAVDSTAIYPSNWAAMFVGLNTGQPIAQAQWDQFMLNMRSVIQSQVGNEYPTQVSYCHYSCHNSCHYSRGRR